MSTTGRLADSCCVAERFEEPAYWNLRPSAVAASPFEESHDRHYPDLASAVPHPDVSGGARDPRVGRLPRRAAALESGAARRRSPGAGAAGPRGVRPFDAAAALLPRQQGL